ncbi:PKD domain-containing protein [Desulfuromonas sp. KJ2020]|uniref:PKD domain-containing protein n=1 Tax=Desulfuromonas sp. KJ2020 TaxID=2919173 RepID=UPI0020A7C971|nr:PKD domain-containing protein [Desulfuromonas sp. KJ2020]MCP3178241.1 PKD domain-containing protein [Desulfuromonas sp. KJ2020]
MARLFEGNSGTSSYDPATGKFNEVNSLLNSAGELMKPFKYADLTDFAKKVDLSLAGNMMDCGECHVGGGAMQYVPYTVLGARTPLRNIKTTDVNGSGPILKTDITAFNYFIDNYDVDGDGNKNEVMHIDYANTGVMEVDCFMCHLQGYQYEERNTVLRKAKIDATRAVGAGFATANTLVWAPTADEAPAGYGNTVVYDAAKLSEDVNGHAIIPSSFFANFVKRTPASENCASCHMGEYAVDWKKRGDHWEGEHDYEVHYMYGCMGCHERMPTAAQPGPFTSEDGGLYPQMGTGLLGHDPAKGNAPYSSLYNGNDNVAFKGCEGCHLTGTNGAEQFGAPDPTAAHQAAGLTARIVQSGIDGVANISHIDLMDCSACHSRKISSSVWNTGGAVVDATGADPVGRLADHENQYVDRNNMTDRTGLSWYNGKLLRVGILNTMFYRDKNDIDFDANLDGRGGGMDALLMTQVLAVNEANGWKSLTEDTHGNVTAAAIDARVAAMNAAVDGWAGVTGKAQTKLSFMGVPFKDQHSVSPAALAWGANGCADCHAAGSEFYRGAMRMVGDDMTMYWNDDFVPYTKANGSTQPTDFHPNTKNKVANRSIAVTATNGTLSLDADGDGTPESYKTVRDVDRSEALYEGTFMTNADFADSYSSTGAIGFAGNEKGWLLKVQAKNTETGVITTRTRAVSGNVADLTALLANLGGFATGDFEFTITDNGAGGITLTADPGYQVRLHPQADSGNFLIANAQWKAAPVKGINGVDYAGRDAWLAYLDTLSNAAAFGIGVDPVAVFSAPATEVTVNTAFDFVADTNANTQGTFTYSWLMNDGNGTTLTGATASHTFTTTGSFLVTLYVEDEEGKRAADSKYVKVVAPAPDTTISYSQIAGTNSAEVTFGNMPTHTRLLLYWGDGTYQWVTDDQTDLTVTKAFRAVSTYDKGTYYQYLTRVYVYNGSSRVDYETATITLNK